MTAATADSDRWMPYPPTGGAPITLYCLPHAGSGASAYLPWRAALHPEIEVVPLQPPGREMRMRETPHTTLESLLTELLTAMQGRWRTPFALFGHSVGALIAFELARRLSAPPPRRLIVSGRRAPQSISPNPLAHTVSDDALVELIATFGGAVEPLRADSALRPVLLGLMRADLAVDETYHHRPEPPLDIPITVLGGSDDTRAPTGELDGWRDCGTAGVEVRIVPGDHFFVVSRREAVVARIRRCLTGSP
ncbi:thioesterase II family protein [Nocardia pseudobrasiliensis]|uniref:Thioesterase TesA n=1 Tax=Nocardia pseudobrasiliensis TaxID=45979 RepID=A0A370HP14_9NOCA|nr:alpha/beta fold hydrolase [Nocardia pseudobrasiliensis]RDI60312.1 surfactin synthase thioesterase subunit [Nocardia pseudobrasiliensis]